MVSVRRSPGKLRELRINNIDENQKLLRNQKIKLKETNSKKETQNQKKKIKKKQKKLEPNPLRFPS
jgi:hypothetical protein